MHCLAISSSAGRFGIRYKIQRLWWDDLLAFLATSIELFFLATLFFIPICECYQPEMKFKSLSSLHCCTIATYFVGVTPPNLIEQATFWYRQFPMLSIVWCVVDSASKPMHSLKIRLISFFPQAMQNKPRSDTSPSVSCIVFYP